MNVLLIGSGGREHALAWKIAQSPLVEHLYCAPGNAGIAGVAECVPLKVNDFDGLLAFTREYAIDLVIVGPEDPLAAGIVDLFESAGIPAFGPNAAAARLEGSKQFAKDFMQRHGIPTAEYRVFDEAETALAYIREKGAPIVVKADGLAAGKGVTVARTVEEAEEAVREIMVDRMYGSAGARLVVEECMVGEEASILAFCDGKTVCAMPSSQDHKPAYDGDLGPNTGGMGAYSPAPVVTPEIMAIVDEQVLRRCVEGMAADGVPYKGCLYAGLMITAQGPKVVEFNCRFGDPETQVVVPRLDGDIVPIFMACCEGNLAEQNIAWKDGACVTVVMASGGYPRDYAKGKEITGIAEAEQAEGVAVFHAGTRLEEGKLVTNGGRVLNVTAVGDTVPATIEKAYRGMAHIKFEGAHYRTDIGQKALRRG